MDTEFNYLIQNIETLKTYEIYSRGNLYECKISKRINDRDTKQMIEDAVVKVSDINKFFRKRLI